MSDLFDTINDGLQSNSEDGSNSTKIKDSSGVAKTASKPTSKTSTSGAAAAAATSETTKDKAASGKTRFSFAVLLSFTIIVLIIRISH